MFIFAIRRVTFLGIQYHFVRVWYPVRGIGVETRAPFRLGGRVHRSFRRGVQQGVITRLSSLVSNFLQTDPFIFRRVHYNTITFQIPILVISNILYFSVDAMFYKMRRFLRFLRDIYGLTLSLLLYGNTVTIRTIPVSVILNSFFIGIFTTQRVGDTIVILQIMDTVLTKTAIISYWSRAVSGLHSSFPHEKGKRQDYRPYYGFTADGARCWITGHRLAKRNYHP